MHTQPFPFVKVWRLWWSCWTSLAFGPLWAQTAPYFFQCQEQHWTVCRLPELSDTAGLSASESEALLPRFQSVLRQWYDQGAQPTLEWHFQESIDPHDAWRQPLQRLRWSPSGISWMLRGEWVALSPEEAPESLDFPESLQLERNGQIVVLELTPDVVEATDRRVGRAGVMLGGAPATVWVQAGFLEGLALGATHTWDVTARSVKSLWQMLVGAGSTAQLSGPVGVAKAAGQSASLGLTTYLQFLAFFSVSLAVINALPIPVLDGGHVMYYLWEWVSGRPPSPEWMLQSQRVGLALIATLMVVAVSNDLVRLWG